MSSHPEYEIRRVTGLEDVDAMLEVEDEAFATNPINLAVMECITTDENRAIQRTLKKTRLLNAMEGKVDKSLNFQWGKAVYTPRENAMGGEKAVAFIGFHAPAVVVDGATTSSIEPSPHSSKPALEDIPAEVLKAREIMQKLFAGLMGKKSEDLMGSDRDAHYWFLSSLETMPEHQQRGLGTRLVQWSIDLARADAKARPGTIKGVWTIATPSGLKTYLRAGMKEIGSEVIDFGKGGGENGQKYVWLLMKFDE
ncbi:hypothetical protein MMC14_009684 [Varicellaria rhodocarpa]|nr:hypothetical protein [Varicellaria rhodocarpa]